MWQDVGHESDPAVGLRGSRVGAFVATGCSFSGRRSLLAAILIPLSVVSGIQYAFLLFVLVMAYGLLAVPQIRRRSAAQMKESTKRWKLRPE